MNASGKALAIIERAHRGAVEQQYAHVLWLALGLHRQLGLGVLLRGDAVLYALRGPRPAALRIAGLRLDTLPDYPATIHALLADGAELFVSAPCLRRLGVGGERLIDGVRPVEDADLAALIEAYERIWYL